MNEIIAGNVFAGNKIKATYSSNVDNMYKHNPFIEALPEIYKPEEVAKRILREPSYSEEERLWPDYQRIQAVQKISNFVFPLLFHFDLERKISRTIRNGYMNRNPIKAEWVKQIRSGFPNIDWGAEGEDFTPVIRSSAEGFSIIGTSGAGKSVGIESVLSLYPQVITHTQYNGHSFDRTQLVWLKIECPFDGRLKGLCLSFFQSIDQILGTNYYKKNRNYTRYELLPIMAQVAAVLGLGVLVIDEIQRLNEAAKNEDKQMLNFFVQLANTIGVPIVLIGTFKAYNLISGELAQGRRNSGQGSTILYNLEQDENWELFINNLWGYQWTNINNPLSKKIKEVMYEESQGIIDIAVKLYMLAQWQVIGTDDEKINANVIRHVARNNLSFVQPILSAIKNKDKDKLQKINDVAPVFNNMVNQQFEQATTRVAIEGTINTLNNRKKTEGSDEDSPVVRVAKCLTSTGVKPKLARKYAEKAVNRHGSELNLQLAMQEALAMVMDDSSGENEEQKGNNKKKKTSSMNSKQNKVSLSGDLREIVEKGKKDKVPPYESLLEADIIKHASEFL